VGLARGFEASANNPVWMSKARKFVVGIDNETLSAKSRVTFSDFRMAFLININSRLISERLECPLFFSGNLYRQLAPHVKMAACKAAPDSYRERTPPIS
jgi:hypothetical protein